MKNIVLFASGNGSNAIKIHQYFQASTTVRVAAIFCNNAKAAVVERAKEHQIPVELFSKIEFSDPSFLAIINAYSPNLIVLAGFLLQVPPYLVAAFPNKIINIHPALLPKYGGKGMYGMHVHRAVFEAKELESGITIHFVNEHYDEGAIIFQGKTNISNCDSPEAIATEVQSLEHLHFAVEIEKILTANE
jgi:phosphoribosylglycinamide formyltransferase-1